MSDGTYSDYLRGGPHSPDVAGNYHDDDAQYVEDLVDTNSFPVHAPSDVMVNPPAAPAKANDRLITGSTTWTPYQSDQISQLLTSDPYRKSLTVRAVGTGTDYLFISDEQNKLGYVGNSNLARMIPVGSAETVDSYTGPIWARPAGASSTLSANNLFNTVVAQPTSATGWLKQAADTTALVAAPWDATRQALQVTCAGGAISFAISPACVGTMVSGQTFTLRLKVVSTITLNATLRLYTGIASTSLVTAAAVTLTANIYQEVTLTGTAPQSGTFRVGIVTVTNPGAGDTLTVGDAILSSAGTPVKYFDAATTNDTTYKIVANADGTANAYAYNTLTATWFAVTSAPGN